MRVALQSGLRLNSCMRDVVLPLGTRCRLSKLGEERCPKWRGKSAIVVGRPAGSTRSVKLDGLKEPITLHISYLEVVIEDASLRP